MLEQQGLFICHKQKYAFYLMSINIGNVKNNLYYQADKQGTIISPVEHN
jgi:hypothetical protein